MSDARESPRDLAAAYALGVLDADEARAFEALLADSPDLEREVAEYREVAALLALADPRSEIPPASLRERVLASTHRDEPSDVIDLATQRDRRTPKTSALIWGALAASLVLATVMTIRQARLATQLAARDSASAAADSTLRAVQQRLAAREQTLSGILEPGVEMFQLTATGNPDPLIQVFWDRGRNTAIVHAFRLDSLPAGRTYQLWFIQDGKPVPSVTFNTETDGHGLVQQIPVPARGKVSAAAVTNEPEGGSPQPTSPILMVGSLERRT